MEWMDEFILDQERTNDIRRHDSYTVSQKKLDCLLEPIL